MSAYNVGDLGLIPGLGLEKEMATHSSTLAWKILWKEEPGRLPSMGHKESDTTEQLNFHLHLYVHSSTIQNSQNMDKGHRQMNR